MAEDNDKRDRSKFKKKRRRICVFCADKAVIDYKDIDFVKRFMSDRGKILPRRTSGNCAKHQRWVAQEVKKARQIGFVPYVVD
ncbi:MAG: 30S ribosomal protein S18 [bacterium]